MKKTRRRVDTYRGRLGKVKLGASAIGFAELEDVDLDALSALIRHAGEVTAA